MSKRKKLLGLLMAVGLSVSMCVTPVLAETTSILDEIDDEELTGEETTEDFAEDTSYSVLAWNKSESWQCENSESEQWRTGNLWCDTVP